MWAIGRNSTLARELSLSNFGATYLEQLDRKIALLRNSSCRGFRSKVQRLSDLVRFKDFLSELEVASFFLGKGGTVRFLPDRYFRNMPNPDLLVGDSVGSLYVEVKHMRDDGTTADIIDGLRKILANYSLAVTVKLGKAMSLPAITHEGIELKRKRIQVALQKLQEALAKSRSNLTKGAVQFEGNRIANSPGFVLTVESQLSIIGKRYIKKLIRDVQEKAQKRLTWNGVHRDYYYVVAIDCDFPQLDEDEAGSMFLGEVAHFRPPVSPPPQRNYKRIEEVAKSSWRPYLMRKAILPGPRRRLTKRGKFLTLPVLNNVSGVLLRLSWDNYFAFFPNPFCESTINSSNLTKFC